MINLVFECILYVHHSKILKQTDVFDHPPEGIRKIVVSTNIVYTSLTIKDILFIIDWGKIKEHK